MACGLPPYTWLVIWLLLNGAVFATSYLKYLRPQYSHLHTMLGRGLCVSRAAAAVINLNSALVLLPVCRGFNSLLFRTLNRVSRSLLSLWLQRLTLVHTTLAVTIVIASVVHSVAHVVNSVNFSHHYNSRHPEINWAKYKGQSPLLMVLSSSAGLTGVAMLMILLLMFLMSLKCVRQRHYDIFWATHFLFLPFLVLLVLHPLSGVLKEQKNYPLHVASCVNTSLAATELPETCFTHPTFKTMECQGWLWVVAAMGVFSADFVLRLLRRNRLTYRVSRVVSLAGGVTQITLTTKQTKPFKAGQYILLQCPRLSSLEWHPFTVTSILNTSSHTSITVLIRRRGDWTKAVCRLFSNCGNDKIVPNSFTPARLLVDGAFCSPMENVLKSKVSVCIAAGIGITPFMAAIDFLHKSDCVRWARPHRLHLVWVVRTLDQLTWAADLITALHHKFWYLNQPDRFEIAFFVTRRTVNEDCLANPLSQSLVERRTQYSRPNWTKLFKEWADLYPKKDVSVFVCGPPSLYSQVKSTANMINNQGCHFTCIHEAFS